jgi:hypothetical protein
MYRKMIITALLCLVCTSMVRSQSNVSLMRLVEMKLVPGSGRIYLIVPGPLNDEQGQGEYYFVFYIGIVNPSPGIVQQTHGMLTVQRANGVFAVVSTVPCRDTETGNVVMRTPFTPDLSLGNDNLIFYRWRDVENWYRCFNDALGMLPSTLSEFQLMIGNNRDYQFTLLSSRNFDELDTWQEFFEVEPPYPPEPPIIVGFSANSPHLLCCILFVICFACGACFFDTFIDSFEKGSL